MYFSLSTRDDDSTCNAMSNVLYMYSRYVEALVSGGSGSRYDLSVVRQGSLALFYCILPMPSLPALDDLIILCFGIACVRGP
jgi:hypothetical protein